jgi:hypothetical protein
MPYLILNRLRRGTAHEFRTYQQLNSWLANCRR